MRVTIEKEALTQPVPELNRLHLVQNIAASGKHRMLAAEGIRRSAGDDVYFVKQPRFHRKRQELRFDQ
jgi:hypothetical protein